MTMEERRRAMELAGVAGSGLRNHAWRVGRIALAAADGLDGERLRDEVHLTALLHDVGKLAMPYRLLQKSEPLDEADWSTMRTHTVEGERLCVAHGFPSRVGRLVRATHERWDGRGYPDGLAGTEIPLPARIVFCADAYDAMTSARPYRAPLDVEDALAELRAGAGSQFDPDVALRLVAVVQRIERRFRRTARDRDPAAALRSLRAG
jgi:putative nucleotidyltransferase with HDIG domain